MNFDSTQQLEVLLGKWRLQDRLDPAGPILDYVSRTDTPLLTIFDKNIDLYECIFEGSHEKLEYSKDQQLTLLRATIRSEKERDEIAKATPKNYPRIHELLAEFENDEQTASDWASEAEEIQVVMWQLSDIHFGRLNRLQRDPVELAALLSTAANLCPTTKPDYLLITGDVSTSADTSEFEQFQTFCDELSCHLWGSLVPQRILVIPGNHDTLLFDDGTTDRLERFAQHFSDSRFCITPYGPEGIQTFEEPGVSVSRHHYGEGPPLALVSLAEVPMEFILLVSSYHSGVVSESFRTLINETVEDKDTSEKVIEYIRNDTGYIDNSYINLLTSSIPETDTARVTLIHHHLESYGALCQANSNAEALRDALYLRGARVALHGHLHLFESESRDEMRTLETRKLCRCIPCSTLCSNTTLDNKGFMIHEFSNSPRPKLSSREWPISSYGTFREANIRASVEHILGD